MMVNADCKIQNKIKGLHVAKLQMLDMFCIWYNAMQNIMYYNANNVKIPM